MSCRQITRLVLVGSLLAVASSARADVPPPPDYVETCSRAYQEADDEYCELHSAYYADPYGCINGSGNDPADPVACENATSPDFEDCCQGWIDDGWSWRCQTYGASAFSALWCRERQDGDPARPEKPESDGCSVSPRPYQLTALGIPFFILGIALLVYRRSASYRRP